MGLGSRDWWLWFGQLKLQLPVGHSNQTRHLKIVLQFCPKSISFPKTEDSSCRLPPLPEPQIPSPFVTG